MEELKKIIRDIPDFPKKGIVFKDITTLLSDARSFHRMIDLIAHRYLGQQIDQIVGVEARGFILGAALAYKLGVGITLVRKPGKLPSKVQQVSYDLEYGTDTLEIHEDAFKKGDKTTRQRELGDNVFTELNKFDNSIYISSAILTKFGLPKSGDVVPAPEIMEICRLHIKM